MLNIIKNLIGYYTYDLKLKNKLIISHLILTLLPMIIISAFLYSHLLNIIVTNTKTSELSMSRETATNIENTIKEIHNISNKIIQHEMFQQLLDLEVPVDDAYLLDSFIDTVESKIDWFLITDIKIYLNLQYEAYYTSPQLPYQDVLQPISTIQNSYWHGIFASTDQKTLLCPTLYLTSYEKEHLGLLSYTRKISDSHGNELAYVTIYFNKTYISSLLNKYTTLPRSAKYIIDNRNALVTETNKSLVGEYFIYYENIPELIPDTNKFVTKKISSINCYISYKEIIGTNWYMVSVIPVNSIWSENKTLFIAFIISYIVVLIFSFIVSLQLSNSIVKRLSNVIDIMNSVKAGKLIPMDTPYGQDEVGDLIESYNYMIEEINKLSAYHIKASNELRTAELKALQAQINPHFLYNTLDMMNWLSLSGRNQEVSASIQALSKFYKMTLSKGNVVVTIKEELEHVSLYMQLQNMRYNNRIHFIIDVPDQLLDYTMPKIIFQPLVENAIQHGILAKASKEGNIVITGWMENQVLVFLISDDGIGMPGELLEQIFSGNVDSPSGSGIAIYNIHNRLQLFYDKEFGLTYRSKEGEYTEVEIRIPAIKGE